MQVSLTIYQEKLRKRTEIPRKAVQIQISLVRIFTISDSANIFWYQKVLSKLKDENYTVPNCTLYTVVPVLAD